MCHSPLMTRVQLTGTLENGRWEGAATQTHELPSPKASFFNALFFFNQVVK